jgi:hypothetical protein
MFAPQLGRHADGAQDRESDQSDNHDASVAVRAAFLANSKYLPTHGYEKSIPSQTAADSSIV